MASKKYLFECSKCGNRREAWSAKNKKCFVCGATDAKREVATLTHCSDGKQRIRLTLAR